jgi:hypothetical protein
MPSEEGSQKHDQLLTAVGSHDIQIQQQLASKVIVNSKAKRTVSQTEENFSTIPQCS